MKNKGERQFQDMVEEGRERGEQELRNKVQEGRDFAQRNLTQQIEVKTYFLPLFFLSFLTMIAHRKKRFTSFPSPAGMSLTKLPLGRNNSVMTSLFPPRESLVVTSRLGTGNSRTFFLRCTGSQHRFFKTM